PVSIVEIVKAFSLCPKKSSHNLDRPAHALATLLVVYPACQKIVSWVYNDALLLSLFPSSWLATLISLLLRKGDLSDLRNWHLILLN
ncbi:uncharacterized protein B0P05DRAFT_475026, partial [Gilbertella persicaria]|uniref:uncharacterized protein n=1 Tax=Gilbertella persicaria TaxID=101096 RepID=UPI0022210D1B